MYLADWAMIGGEKKAPTAKSYVQDGLVAMWDGIENAGWGTHDAAATTWKNLAGNGELVFTNGITINDDSVGFNFGQSAYSNNNMGLTTSNVLHGEICIDIAIPPVSMQYSQFAGSNSRVFAQATVALGGISLASGQLGHGTWPSGKHTMSAYWPTNALYIDSVLRETGTKSDTWGTRSKSTIIGDVVMQSGTARGFNGRVFSIRIYSRALTADEIAANDAIDKQRFNLPDA